MSSSYRVYSVRDLDRLPPLRWLVKGVLPEHSFSVLYGLPGVGKSFVALDLAHNLGLGNTWFDHDTITGGVFYVSAGEGGQGLKYRTKAWRVYNETVIENVAYGLDAVQLPDPKSVDRFLKAIEDLDLSLIVFDTLARCAAGVDENTVEGMGQVVQGVDRIRAATGAAVMLVHHATKPDKDGHSTYRGSSALEGAVDTMIELTREKGSRHRLLMNCKKQKDGREFFPIRFKLETVDLPTGESAVPVKR